MSIGKSYVNETLRKHAYEIQVLRKKLKHHIPKPMPLNKVWAIDITGKQDSQGNIHSILGLIEHGSRASLCLAAVKNKVSITLLRCLLDAIEKYGTPTFLRTDNESIFSSRLFRMGLWLLGIRHQQIDRGCPWQNGRVERFFPVKPRPGFMQRRPSRAPKRCNTRLRLRGPTCKCLIPVDPCHGTVSAKPARG